MCVSVVSEGALYPPHEKRETMAMFGIGAKGDWWKGENAKSFQYDGNNPTVGPGL